MSDFITDEEMQKLEADFISDEQMGQLEESGFISDEQMQKLESPSFLSGLTTPFQGEEKKYSAQINSEARDFLKKQGYDADSWSDTAITGIMSMANTLSAGFAPGLAAKAYGVPEEVYRAALDMREKNQPLTALAGNIAGYIPGGALGGAKALAVPAAQAVGTAVQGAEEGGGVEAAGRALSEEAVGLAVGFGIGKAISKALKGGSKKAIKDELLDEGLGSEQADAITEKALNYKFDLDKEIPTINQLSDAQAQEFERVLLAGQKIEDYPYEDLGEALDLYRNMKASKQAMLEEAGLDQSSAASLGMKMMDAQYVGNMADRRYAKDVMPTMNAVSRDMTQGLWNAKELKTTAQSTLDELDVSTLAKSKALIKAVEAGRGNEGLVNLFEHMRVYMNDKYKKAGLGDEVIKPLKGKDGNLKAYIPHHTKRAPELVATLRQRIRKTTGEAPGKVSNENIKAIRADEDLMDSLKYVGGFLGKKENMLNDERLIKLVRSINHSTESKKMMDVAAASVKERLSEDVPELIREYDIGRLLGGWIDSTTSDAAMRKNLMKLRADAEALKDVDPQMSAYINNYVTDVSGGSRWLAGWAKGKMNDFSAKQYEKALNAKDANQPLKVAYHEAMAEFPQYAQYMQAQLYPYFLGMRVDAVVRNLTQPYMLTLPEIGGDVGYKTKLITNSMPNTIKGLFVKEGNEVFDEMARKGWMPPDPTPGQFQTLRKGVESGGKFKKGARKLLEKANNLAMIGYQQSDVANRVVTMGVGKQLAKDIMGGHPSALNYVKKLPPAYRKQVQDALAAGDAGAVTDRVLDHLMATTQFNYNRASMSEYGREFGSAFSQFSKWPTAIGADIFDGYDAAKFEKLKGGTRLPGGTEKVLRKYLAPYAMLAGAGHLYFGEEGPSPRGKQLVSADISSASPITSVISPLSDPGRAFTPPVFSAIKEFASGEGVNTTFGLLPLATYGRFMVERLPPLVEDERGQKPSEFTKEFIGIE